VVEGKASYDRGDRSREIRFTHPPGHIHIHMHAHACTYTNCEIRVKASSRLTNLGLNPESPTPTVTYPPTGQLNSDDFNSRPGWYIENDIYYLEVCVLNEMCANGAEIFTKAEGEAFVCEFDAALWAAAGKALTWL